MRLVGIRPRYFRGFGESDWINLDADLVLIFGPNGFGKSSLTEAIEWLLFGSTKRRLKGDGYSREEYRGSYRNAHAPESEDTLVQARVRLDDGPEVLVERRLLLGTRGADEGSRLLVAGEEADPSALGLRPEDPTYPVIVQHGLQDFIHTRPIDRRDAISAALGLDSLVALGRLAERVKNNLDNRPPHTVSRARTNIRRATEAMQTNTALASIAARWSGEEVNIHSDRDEVLEICRDALGLPQAEWDEVSEAVQTRRRQVAREVFGDGPIRPPEELGDKLAAQRDKQAQAAIAIKDLLASARQMCEAAAQAYAEELVKFWQAGLELLDPDNPEMCPMCEAKTLTAAKQRELRERITQSRGCVEAREAMVDARRATEEALRELPGLCRGLLPRFLEDDAREALRALVSEDHLTAFLRAHDEAKARRTQAVEALNSLPDTIGALTELLEAPGDLRQGWETAHGFLEDLGVAARLVRQAAADYQVAFSTFEPILAASVSSHQAVRELDALIAAADDDLWLHLRAVVAFDRMLDDLLREARAIRAFLERKQEELINARGAEVMAWYDLLSPGADVRFAEMEPATNAIKLHANSFGQRISAAACLSQSQLNCLGLGLYLMIATAPSSPFGFVVLDDPVQSFDDEHKEEFILSLVPSLLDQQGLQVIVLTHLDSIARRLRAHNLEREPVCLRFTEFAVSGPVCCPFATIRDEVTNLRQQSQGDEEARRACVDRMRVLIERVIKETYRARTNQSVPDEYRRASGVGLLGLLNEVPTVNPSHVRRLEDTIGFCDPSHHDDPDWQVPLRQQIQPHVDFLYTMAREYEVLDR